MKYRVPFFLLILGIIAWGCSSETSQDQEADTTVVEAPNRNVPVPEDLTLLFVPNKGVIRGHRFNESMDAVQGRETAELIGQSGNTLNYSLGMNDAEFADITYEFQNDELERIRMDIFAASSENADSYGKELTGWFNQKYTARPNLWDGSEEGVPFTSFMKVIDDPESPGLIIVWEKMQNIN